jgi:hypothetical protein
MTGPSVCPLLRHLSKLLLLTYHMRDRLVTQTNGGSSVMEAELDILRMHNVITRHRELCSRCKFDGVLREVSSRETLPRSKVMLIN